MFYNMDVLFVRLLSSPVNCSHICFYDYLSVCLSWLSVRISVLCGNRDGLKSVNGRSTRTEVESESWDVSLGCVDFEVPLPPKPYFYSHHWHWCMKVGNFLPLARSRTLKVQFWYSGLWLWMLLHSKRDFNSVKPSFVVPKSAVFSQMHVRQKKEVKHKCTKNAYNAKFVSHPF